MPKITLVAKDLDEVVHRKLVKQKDGAGFGNRSWADYFRFITKDEFLKDNVSDVMQKTTRNKMLGMWCNNFAENVSDIRKGYSISDLVPNEAKTNENVILGPAIVVGRGPSIYKHKHLNLLAKSGFSGNIIASDGSLIDCLKQGIIPNYVVSVDGNNELIWKWYDHPLVDKYGSQIKAILCVSVAHNVVERCNKAGIKIYWFNPQFDDYRKHDSFTKIQMLMTSTKTNPNGSPNVACGGNAGATAWVIATNLLRRSPVGLIGIDLGYLVETPMDETSYYKSLMDGTNNNVNIVSTIYKTGENPFFKVKFKTDTVFQKYKESWIEMLKQTRPNIRTINCTEGGSLFSVDKWVPLEYMKFKDFLKEFA